MSFQSLGANNANLDAVRGLIKANRIITVSKDGNSDFCCVATAFAAIGTDPRYPASSTDNRYMILQLQSSDGTDSVFHIPAKITWSKAYVSWQVLGGHDAVKNILDVDDDAVEVTASDCQFLNVNIRRTAVSATGKACFKTSGSATDIVFNNCKSNNFDIGWLIGAGPVIMRDCQMTLGTGSCMIECTASSTTAYNCSCSSTINNAVTAGLGYAVYVTGAGVTLNMYNFADTSVAGGGTKIGSGYATASAVLMTVNGYHSNGTNGLYSNGGYIIIQGSEIRGCTNNLRGAGTGYIEGNGLTMSTPGSYNILQDAATCAIRLVASSYDVGKTTSPYTTWVSLPAGSTTFKSNEVITRDTVGAVSIWTASFMLISDYLAQFSNTTIAGATTRDMSSMQCRMIFIYVGTMNVAGTLVITAVPGGGTAGSYNKDTGATTSADTENIVVGSTGWYISTKRWYQSGAGVIRLSASGGLDIAATDIYKVGRAEDNASYVLRSAKFTVGAAGGAGVFQAIIEKWSPTLAVPTQFASTVWDTSTGPGGTNVDNNTEATFFRDALNTAFNNEADKPEFMIVRFVSPNNRLTKVRMILEKEYTKF